MSYKILKIKKKRGLVGGGLLAVVLAIAAYLFIPTADIAPAAGQLEVSLGMPVEIHASPLSHISKIAVYADDRLLGMEYNLETGNLIREFDLKPGQQVRVETKVTSPMGITREFVSTFTTVAPVKLASVSVNGSTLQPGQKIPPQPTLAFSFDKPVSTASVSLDGGDAIELQVVQDNPTVAVLPPTVSLKQGAVHLLKLVATGEDSSQLAQPAEIRMQVVKPLSLYGKVHDNGGQTIIELDSNVAFRDPTAIKRAITTTIPEANIAVETQKIIISCGNLDHFGSYNIYIGSAEGIDGSFLESPLNLVLSYKTGETLVYSSGLTQGAYRGYVYTPGGGDSSQAPPAGGSSAESGPPPGWPPCCPWPPR